MEQTVVHHLTPVIGVIEENCVNCHRCIAVCPVKYCIDGSGDTVIINHDLCIGCGSCISACSHDARTILDDTTEFREALSRGESYVAVVAPAVAANFPDQWKNLFGFLSRKGVKAFFDVGFGAELTVKTYREYMAEANPETVIAQPCPALVSYMELFQPDLLRHLAPADSPMAHTIKMVGAYFPEYAGQRIVVLSPCLAKRREFDEVAPGALNVTFKGIDQWLMDEDIDLDEFPEVDFSGPVGERAVGFSTPGGLRQTLARDVPDLVPRVRKIEGPESVYPYLDSLGESLALGVQPALVDCLNCERGCNGGPGTITAHRTIDEIEGDIRAREIQAMKDRRTEDVRVDKASRRVAKNLTDYWRPGLYARDYLDRSGSAAISIPGDAELRDIYRRLRKTTKKDYLDCRACGYESCEQMAGAIHNGLNKPENCHHTRQWMILEEKESMRALYEGLSGELSSCNTHMNDIRRQLAAVNESVKIQSVSLEDSTEAVEQMMNTVRGLAERAVERRNALESLVVAAGDGEQDMSRSIEAIDLIAESIDRIGDMVTIINDIASRTDLLSFNAAIEAAHAGASGRGFAVVAGEIKNLAQGVGENARSVGLQLRSVRERTDAGNTTTRRAGNAIQSLIGEIRSTAEGFRNMIESTSEMAAGSGQVSQALENLKALSSSVHAATDGITETISALSSSMDRIAEKTSKNQTDIEELTSGVM